jgi:hypothetical protein
VSAPYTGEPTGLSTGRDPICRQCVGGATLTLPSPASGRGSRTSAGPRPFSRLREKAEDEGLSARNYRVRLKSVSSTVATGPAAAAAAAGFGVRLASSSASAAASATARFRSISRAIQIEIS